MFDYLRASQCLPAAVPMAVKSLWSASFRKKPPKRRGISRRNRPPSIDVKVLQDLDSVDASSKSTVLSHGRQVPNFLYMSCQLHHAICLQRHLRSHTYWQSPLSIKVTISKHDSLRELSGIASHRRAPKRRGAYCEPKEPMPPPTIPPPCTKGPSFPAMSPAAMENTTPISFATSVLACAATWALGGDSRSPKTLKRSMLITTPA